MIHGKDLCDYSHFIFRHSPIPQWNLLLKAVQLPHFFSHLHDTLHIFLLPTLSAIHERKLLYLKSFLHSGVVTTVLQEYQDQMHLDIDCTTQFLVTLSFLWQ